MRVKRHAFDPISFVLGLAFAALGLFFLVGDRSVADIGAQWIWPFPVLLVGLLAVISAVRRMIPVRESPALELPDSEDEREPDAADEPID